MTKSEIMAELPRLRAEDRQEILERLWQMEEATLLHGGAPDPAETALLDRELIAFERDGQNGSPWREDALRLTRGQLHSRRIP